MGVAIKGSLKQYMNGLKDSFYGLIYFYQLDQKIKEQNERKRERIQEEIQARRRRSRFESRRSTVSSPATGVSVNSEPTLCGRIALSAAMSSFIWISIWSFNTFLLPTLRHQAQVLIPQPSSSSSSAESKLSRVWENTEVFLHYIFSSLWVLPLYIISKIVNGFWFVDVSNSVYQLYHGKPRLFSSHGKMVADFIYSLAVETIFLVQATMVKHIPVMEGFSYFMYCVHHCMLYALYAFEYKWFNMGLDVRLRILMVEMHWPYFCGFGTPLFLVTSLTYSYYPTVISACVFSILFPFFIVSATKAGTPRDSPAVRLRVFELSMTICNIIFKSSVQSRTSTQTSRMQNQSYVNRSFR